MDGKNIVVIFDWDDTLLDAGKLLSESQAKALKSILRETEKYPFTKNWIAPTKEEIYKNAGHRFEEKILPLVMPHYDQNNHLHKKWAQDAKSQFLKNYSETQKKAFPGVFEMLSNLKKEKFKLAIATNKNRKLLEDELICSKLNQFFDITVAGDDPEVNKKNKPDPEMINQIQKKFKPDTKFFMIGDRPFDMQAAKSSIYADQTTRIGIESQKDCILDADLILRSASLITPEIIRKLTKKQSTAEQQ